MALEASDLNDGTILQQTKQNVDMRGSIQFEIVLPSGRVLKSEFINRDNAKKALFAWIETVKEQAVADSNAERLERAAKAKRASSKMDIERRPGDDQPLFRAGGARTKEMEAEQERSAAQQEQDRKAWESLNEDQPVVPTETTAISKIIEHATKLDQRSHEVDPLEFAKAQHDIQAKRVAELKDAERKLWQWTTIINTLEENAE